MLFFNGAIFDGFKPLPDGHALLVEGARIKDVGPISQFAGYAGERFDMAGATLLPGLIAVSVWMNDSKPPTAS